MYNPAPPSGSSRQCRSRRSAAASALLLHWWALHGAEGAEHTTVARLRAQQRLAVAALVEELAGIRGHGHLRCEAAVRAGQYGVQHNGVHVRSNYLPWAITRCTHSSWGLKPAALLSLSNRGNNGSQISSESALRRRNSCFDIPQVFSRTRVGWKFRASARPGYR